MRWLEYTIFLAMVVGLVKPVGLYLARVFERKPTFLDQAIVPGGAMLYRVFGIDPEREMSAPVYIFCFILFTVLERSCCSSCCCFKRGCRADRTTVTSPRR